MSAFKEAWQDAHDYHEALGYPEQDCCDYADQKMEDMQGAELDRAKDLRKDWYIFQDKAGWQGE